MNPTYKLNTPVSVETRSQRISALLPLLSSLRHSKNTAALATSVHLQAAIRDLERLSDIEMQCRAVDNKTTPQLRLKLVEILEKP
jgi:hypothetical protein